MTVHRNDSLHIKLLPEARQIWIECLQTLNPDTFKDGLEKALALSEKNNVRQWLIDARKIGELSEEEESWVQVNFFPKLMNANSTCYIAMVVDNKCYDRMLLESGWFGLKSYNTFIKVNTFYNTQDAGSWLNSRAADAA